MTRAQSLTPQDLWRAKVDGLLREAKSAYETHFAAAELRDNLEKQRNDAGRASVETYSAWKKAEEAVFDELYKGD